MEENNPDMAMDPAIVEKVADMTGFFFGGGEPSRIMKTLYREGRVETAVMAAVREKWKAGVMVAGTSAGIEVFQDGVVITGEIYKYRLGK